MRNRVLALLILFLATRSFAAEGQLAFDPANYVIREVTIDGRKVAVRAWENVSYVARPVDPTVQVMNIYVPEAYFRGERIGRFTAATAPIFLPNQVGGFLPARAGDLQGRPGRTIAAALARGFVVASPGARGRTSQDASGEFTGKAPAAVVDLKAAVRYLRSNDTAMPGTARKIISNGTSAGGALSALLGASGNSDEFAADLAALGAATAPDDIFAASAYCPIIDLEHADAAYEWQLHDVHDYDGRESGTLTQAQQRMANELATAFPAYVNGLKLRDAQGQALTLDAKGDGPFRDAVKALVIASAQRALDAGRDLANLTWIRVEGGKVRDLDFDAYVRHAGRMKQPPAFDSPGQDSPENQLFGTDTIDKRHFTLYGLDHNKAGSPGLAEAALVRRMNPQTFLGQPRVTTARYWRIRHGTKDRDTSLAIPTILATALTMQGKDVDFALPWEQPHGGDYDLDELFVWMERISGSD